MFRVKKATVVSLVLATFSAGLIARPVSAHVLKTDGSIGAVLHIQPDDNPVSGSPTTYILSFSDISSDSTHQFNLQDCGCKVEILEQGHLINSAPLVVTDQNDSQDVYTFPTPDVYTMRIAGIPKKPGQFQSFSLEYLIRVQSPAGSASMQAFPLTLWIGIGCMIGLLILAAYRMA